MADTPLPPQDTPGLGDDTAPSDPLVQGLEAARDTPVTPEGADISAGDAGATAFAEKMGDTTQKA